MSFETSFDLKQPKLEPKLVSALSETKRLFRLFRFYTETESFDVLIEPKQTKAYFAIFYRKFMFFSFFFLFFLGFFGLFRNSLFRCFSCFASIPKQRVSIDPKQTEDPPKQFKREYIWVFFRKFWVVSVCLGLLRNSSVCFWFHETNRNKRETDLVSVCFRSNRKLFLFVSRTPYASVAGEFKKK